MQKAIFWHAVVLAISNEHIFQLPNKLQNCTRIGLYRQKNKQIIINIVVAGITYLVDDVDYYETALVCTKPVTSFFFGF